MGVSKNRGTQKWIVYNGKPYWNGWFGGTIIFGNTHTYIYIPRSSSGCTISVPKGISEPGVEVLKFLLGSFFNFQLVLDWLATLNIHSRHPWCPLCRFSHFYLQVSQSAKSTDKLLRSQSVDQGIGPRNRIIANSTISHTLTIQCYSMVSAMDPSWFFWYIRMDAPATGLL